MNLFSFATSGLLSKSFTYLQLQFQMQLQQAEETVEFVIQFSFFLLAEKTSPGNINRQILEKKRTAPHTELNTCRSSEQKKDN